MKKVMIVVLVLLIAVIIVALGLFFRKDNNKMAKEYFSNFLMITI